MSLKKNLLKLSAPLWGLLKIPHTNDSMQFEDFYHDLNMPLMDENEYIRTVMNSMSDEDIIYQKGENPERVFKDGDSFIPRKGLILMGKYFIAKRLELIKKYSSDLDHKSLLDVGATSDVFFRFLNKTGVGVNISERAVQYMKDKGIEAFVGNAEDLQFGDNSFDYLFCFETIEHLENPVRSLRELKRVAKEAIFITIPNVRKTNLCTFEFKDRGMHRWHFLEFNKEDFKRILSRVGLKVEYEFVIRPFGKPRTWRQKLFVYRWRNHPWFMGFVFMKVSPDES